MEESHDKDYVTKSSTVKSQGFALQVCVQTSLHTAGGHDCARSMLAPSAGVVSEPSASSGADCRAKPKFIVDMGGQSEGGGGRSGSNPYFYLTLIVRSPAAGFAAERLQRSGGCHESEVAEAFRKAAPRLRSPQAMPESRMRDFVRVWARDARLTPNGFWKVGRPTPAHRVTHPPTAVSSTTAL